jgi:hypothetical protein
MSNLSGNESTLPSAAATDGAEGIVCCWVEGNEVVTGLAQSLTDGRLLLNGVNRLVRMGIDVHPLGRRSELAKLALCAWRG